MDWNNIIFQTYECSLSQLPDEYKKTSDLWKSFYPSWKYKFSDSETRRKEVVSILNLSENAAEVYDNYSGAIQSDFWRFAMTGFYGGMYCDLDSIPISNIESILPIIKEEIEMIALPEGGQRDGKPGSNTCNYILRSNSELGQILLNQTREFLEKSGESIKNNKKPPSIQSTEFFANIVVSNKAKIAQIFDERFVSHGLTYKPSRQYTDEFEKKTNSEFFSGSSTPDVHTWKEKEKDVV